MKLQYLKKGFVGPALEPKMSKEQHRERTEDQMRKGRQGTNVLLAESNKWATHSGINIGKPRSVHD